MIKVTVSGYPGGQVRTRTAQIISPGPPGIRAQWARTCDDQPPEWLLVTEETDRMTARTSYHAVHGNAGMR